MGNYKGDRFNGENYYDNTAYRAIREVDDIWTKEEVEFLEDNIKTMTEEELAESLDRSEESIRRKIKHVERKSAAMGANDKNRKRRHDR